MADNDTEDHTKKTKNKTKRGNDPKSKSPSGKAKGTKTSTKKPTTVLDKVVVAIRSLKSGPKGCSRASIQKYLKSEFDYENANALKTALKKGVSNDTLLQTGQSFRVAADPIPKGTYKEEEIQLEDVKMGKEGQPTASNGDVVTVMYRGTLATNGYMFDKAKNFTFVLGAGEVIKGWDLGIVGMKIGGSRKLVVPPKLGYGKRGCAPDIPGNATLHFTVSLKKIESS